MGSVLYSPSASHDNPLYFMYREVSRNETDRTGMQSHTIRYDMIVIPLGYGHVTLNPTPNLTLAMANLVSTAFSSEYR